MKTTNLFMSYLCGNCLIISEDPPSLFCQRCTLPLVSVKALWEHEVIRVRDRIARRGIKAATPQRESVSEASQQNKSHISAFLTEFRAA